MATMEKVLVNVGDITKNKRSDRSTQIQTQKGKFHAVPEFPSLTVIIFMLTAQIRTHTDSSFSSYAFRDSESILFRLP